MAPISIATINPTTVATDREFATRDAAEIERRLSLADSAVQTLRITTTQRIWMQAVADALEADVD